MIVLDGTTGITTPGLTNTGSTTIVALTTTGNTILGDASTDTLNVGNGNLVTDASGNVGVGVTPSAWSGYTAFQTLRTSVAGDSGNSAYFSANWYNNAGDKYIANGYATQYVQYSGVHAWKTAPSGTAGNAITFTQAMTLDASGNLLVGTTSSTALQNNSTSVIGANATGAAGVACFNSQNGNTVLQVNQTLDDNAARGQIYFYRNESLIGSITSSNTTTAFNNLSDYRLKHDIQTMTGALAKVALLKPCTYKWNADGSDGEGFVAHELAEVCPHAVTGEKDAIDEDGNPKYQGIDTSFLVATLTAAIQEQQALITTLTARITALESA